MSYESESLSHRFEFNTKILGSLTQDFTDDDFHFMSANGGNPCIWILGHIVLYRRVMIRRLGETIGESSWEEFFYRNTKAEQLDRYPSANELLTVFQKNLQPLQTRLTNLSDEGAKSDWGRKFPDGSETVLGGLNFLHFHESYHLGQIGYLRRLLGKPGLA